MSKFVIAIDDHGSVAEVRPIAASQSDIYLAILCVGREDQPGRRRRPRQRLGITPEGAENIRDEMVRLLEGLKDEA